MSMTRKELIAGGFVRQGMSRGAPKFVVDTVEPCSAGGTPTKGGRFVRLRKIDEFGDPCTYTVTRTVSELTPDYRWEAHHRGKDELVIEEFGDGAMAREADQVQRFFESVGMGFAVVRLTHETLEGQKVVNGWSILNHRIDWKKLLEEFGVTEGAK